MRLDDFLSDIQVHRDLFSDPVLRSVPVRTVGRSIYEQPIPVLRPFDPNSIDANDGNHGSLQATDKRLADWVFDVYDGAGFSCRNGDNSVCFPRRHGLLDLLRALVQALRHLQYHLHILRRYPSLSFHHSLVPGDFGCLLTSQAI